MGVTLATGVGLGLGDASGVGLGEASGVGDASGVGEASGVASGVGDASGVVCDCAGVLSDEESFGGTFAAPGETFEQAVRARIKIESEAS